MTENRQKPPFAFCTPTYHNEFNPGTDGKMARTVARDNARIAAENERPPQAGLVVIGRMSDGNPVWGRRPSLKASDAPPERPLWRYTGMVSPTLVYGELRHRGEKVHHDGWPTEPDCEPANESARQVRAYFDLHRNDPRLPSLAWDAERNCVNTIPIEASAGSTRAEMMQPHLRTRDPSRPSAHVDARVARTAGEDT